MFLGQNLLSIVIICGLSSAILGAYTRRNIRIWTDHYSYGFLDSTSTIVLDLSDLSVPEFVFLINISNMPLLSLLLTRISTEQIPMPETSIVESVHVSHDYAVKDNYWRKRIVYAHR